MNNDVVLRIHVHVTNVLEVTAADTTVRMILFDGYCRGPLFGGNILPGAVDTQKQDKDGRTSLSARYILEGMDETGENCRIFIQNTAVAGPGERMLTKPKIYTDSKHLKWMEKAKLYGEIEGSGDELTILIKKCPQSAKETA